MANILANHIINDIVKHIAYILANNITNEIAKDIANILANSITDELTMCCFVMEKLDFP